MTISIRLILGLALVLLMPFAPDLPAKQALAAYCVVPLLFGLDLICTALSRLRRRAMA